MDKKIGEFWLVVGSQTLYGPQVLETVERRAWEMAEELSRTLPWPLACKAVVKSGREITGVIREANYDGRCLGIVAWCHTFSPSKMWLSGLAQLQKPYCHPTGISLYKGALGHQLVHHRGFSLGHCIPLCLFIQTVSIQNH